MKKRFIALLVVLLMIVISLTACGEKTKIISSEKTQEVAGSYFLFQTVEVQEYLSFLEDFDETKYEIVDISTSLQGGAYGSDEFYMVTYRVLSEAE